VCVCVYIHTHTHTHTHTYDISSLRVNDLTLILLTWRKWRAPNNASKYQMGFNSVFKGLKYSVLIFVENIYKMQHLEGSGTPVLYMGRTVLKG